MQKNSFYLTFDSGNTNTKIGLSQAPNRFLSSTSYENLKNLISHYDLDRENTIAIVSNVTKQNLEIPFKTYYVKNFFNKKKFLEMPVSYTETLGQDRLALGYYLYKKDNIPKIIIDSGTFTTIDFIDIKGFNGGYILPGLKLIQQTYQAGEQLAMPKDIQDESFFEQLPQSTENSIAHGALLSFISPVLSVIQKYPQFQIHITGGNAQLIESIVKKLEQERSASTHLNPNLIHEALAFILNEVKE